MQKHNKALTLFLLLAFATLITPASAQKKDTIPILSGEITGTVTNVLWQRPGNLSGRDLFYGAGGKQHEPRGEFTFLEEDLDGSNPKLVVRDDSGVKWKIKLGAEARPEVSASRLVWAIGYHTDEDYFVAAARIREMPARLHRGRELVDPDGTIHDARFERDNDNLKKVGIWRWRRDPFTGTRAWNGLRTLMALINGWDLKDVNNSIFEEKDHPPEMRELLYAITDLGATFGAAGLERHHEQARGNLDYYSRSKFIKKVRPDTVDFENPRRPVVVALVNPPHFFMRLRLRWIGRDIPRADARWMGELLGELSPSQLRDAFRAAGFTPQEVEGFSSVLKGRIAQLKNL